jgi:hypothetical protein
MQGSIDTLQQQLSALDTVAAAHSLRQQQHQAAGSSLERELERHAAAESAAQGRRAEAEGAASTLELAMAERKGVLDAREQALQRAREEHRACQVSVTGIFLDPALGLAACHSFKHGSSRSMHVTL